MTTVIISGCTLQTVTQPVKSVIEKIQNIDDSAVDHIKQYWMGGRTIPENARLTHRFCNMARSRNE